MMRTSKISKASNSQVSPKNSIKLRKRSQHVDPSQTNKRSVNVVESLQHEKALARTYRQKNERNTIKCRFLYNKLNALGSLEGVPQMIASQVSEVDVKIKELEFQLHFKKSQQMKQLKKKVANFLKLINFDLPQEQMEKIEDEIEIILFLLDIFEQKFNEMTTERKQISQIIARLEQGSIVHQAEDTERYRIENQQLMQRISLLENELQNIKNQEIKKIQNDFLVRANGLRNASGADLSTKPQQMQQMSRRMQQLQTENRQVEARYQIVLNNLDRAKREENNWKERYRVMEGQKDERIKLLEQSISKKLKR